MNKNYYRLVFSRVRGMLVAVQETANATGKTNRGETQRASREGASRGSGRFAMRHAAFAVLIAAGAMPRWADAQIVGAGPNAPSVVQTPNGLPQVNINRPGGAGVSLNTYSQFDVQKGGAILNNAAGITSTQQAGVINGNPNFGANDAARIIVNQVNSANPSQLRGFVEVAGQRAEVIISNPSGIYVDGGGFINTSRAVLTTGVPFYDRDGGVAGFNVNRGLVTVAGAGLNASNVDQVDILARAVQANASIYGDKLNVIAGANQIDHGTLAAKPIQGDGAAPAVAIDVAQLGGMYANRVYLVGNSAGVGVANAGTIAAQAGDLTLQSDGRLVLTGKTTALGNLLLSAAGGIDNSGAIDSRQSVEVKTAADLTNSGTLAAQQNATVNAGSIHSTGALSTGVDDQGKVVRAGDLNLTASGQLTATGRNTVGGNAALTGGSMNLAGGQTAANGSLSLTAKTGDVNLANAITSAQRAVTATAAGAIVNDHGKLSSDGSVTLTGGSVSNQGGKVSAQGPLSVQSSGQVANQSGTLVSQSTLEVHGDGIANQAGTIQGAGQTTVSGASVDNSAGRIASLNGDGLTVTTTGRLLNAAGVAADGAPGGVLGGNGKVTVRSGDLVNRGKITAGTDLQVTGQTVDNSDGILKAARATTIEAGARLTNRGGTIVGQTAKVGGTTLDNRAGTVQADQVSLTSTDLLNQGGTITQTGAGAMRVEATGTLDNSGGGLLETESTDLTLAPTTLVNDGGTITHAGTGTLTLGGGTGSISNAGGKIAGNGRVVAETGTLNNTAGSINGQGGLTANVGGLLNNASGKLSSDTALDLTSGTLANDDGRIGANTATTIHSGSLTNRGGTIVAPSLTATLDATLDNSGGKLEANQLALTAKNLTNHGGTITQYGAAAMGMDVSGTLDNSQGGVVQTNSTDLTLKPGELNNAGGTITHGGTGTLTIEPGGGSGMLNNAAGTIVTKGQAVVNAGRLNNASGILSARGAMRANIVGEVINTQGLMRSDGALSLTNGGALVNRGGHIQAGQSNPGDASTLDVRAASIDNADGAITDLGAGKMTVQGGSRIDNSHANGVAGMGTITGNGDVTIQASSISNTQGGQLSGVALTVRADVLDNSGGRIGNVVNSRGDVTVATAGAVTNANGQIGSTHSLTVTAATLQGGGAYSATYDASMNLQGDFSATPDYTFSVGHDFGFSLPGTFTNRGNLESVHNLSIQAGNIVNVGALSAGGLLRTQSANLTNTGAIVGGSTSINATDTVSNLGRTAVIGGSDSNGLLEILARHIENRDDASATDAMAQTAIFGMGRVVLAGGKDGNGNYTNAALVNNSSALIQSGGDMELHADRVTNTRRVMTTTTGSIDPSALTQFDVPIKGRTGEVGVADPTSIGGVYTKPPQEDEWNSSYQYTTYYADSATATTLTGVSAAAQIVSGGKIDATTVGNLQNYWSNIAAVGDIQMPQRYDADGWAATGQHAPGVSVSYSGQYHYNNYDNSKYNWQLPFGNAPFVTGRPGGYAQAAPAYVKRYALPDYHSTLAGNGKIAGTGVSINNTAANATIPSLGLIPGQAVPGLTVGGPDGSASGGKTGAVAVRGGRATSVDPIIASATALNVLNNLTIPQGGLYKPTELPNASYVIETNPAFTNQKTFISSDYFFKQLGVDLTHVPKRLGDGFYEQQLVRNEITALTGKAVLGPYTDLQTMYQSLLTAGAALQKELALPVGASLTAEQVSKLTRNVVMMETQVVDGHSVLVPVVYLAKASQQNMGNGPLIVATDIDIKDAQSFVNSGTIKADNTLALQGKQIDNAFGALESGGLMSLTTTGNVDLTSAKVKAGSLSVAAGGDLILDTATKTEKRVSRDGATGVFTTLGPTGQVDVAGDAAIVTGGNVRQNAGNLTVGGNLGANIGGDWTLGTQQVGEHKVVQLANGVSDTNVNSVVGSTVKVGGASVIGVGGDFTAKGAQIELGGGGAIAAKGNVTLGTASATSVINSNGSGGSSGRSYVEQHHSSDETLTGTVLKGGQTVTIAAGKDITLSGSAISLDKGNANLVAVGDVNVGAATETHVLNSHETHSHSVVVSGSKVASGIDQTLVRSLGSMISADGVNVASGKDLNVTGSTIVGTNDVSLTAARDVNIKTSQDTVETSSYYQRKDSGLMSGGGLSVSVGTSKLATTDQSSSVTHNASAVGSLKGNLNIAAGNDLHVTGSDLVAGGNLTGTGANVIIDSVANTMRNGHSQTTSSSGVTVGLSGALGGAISGAYQQSLAARDGSGDLRAKALHSIAAAGDVGIGAVSATQAIKEGKRPDIGVQVSVGSSHSRIDTSENMTTQQGSSVRAGGTVAIAAKGSDAPGSGNITVAGSNVAGTDVILAAKNQIDLRNTANTDSTRTSNASSGSSVGVSIGTGGIGISASMQRAHGDGNSDATMHNNSHVTGANSVTLVSGGDTNVIGSNVTGKTVTASVGGNLNVVSVQDTTYSAAHQSSASGGINASLSGGDVSFSVSNGHAGGNYAGVNEQAGIQAGTGGFDIDVKGNTKLTGAYIGSTADESKNVLKTGTLSFSDIENHSHYSANSSGFTGGAGVSVGGGSAGGSGGLAPMMFMSDNGDQQSTTYSGVSAGTIHVTSPEGQVQDLAGLKRDTADLNGKVDKTPDVNDLLTRQADVMQAAQAAGQVVAQGIGMYADMKRGDALKAAEDAEKRGDVDGMRAALNEADSWKEGGANRIALHVAGGALIGGVGGGGIGSAMQGAAGAGVSSALAGKLNDVAGSIGEATGSMTLGNVVSNVLAGLGGALVGGTTGAVTASNADRFNRQLYPEEYVRAEKYAKDVAKELGISNGEAEGRILAEIMRNSDQQTAQASGGVHDYEVRRIVGCQNLNCDGYKNDSQYANHDYNSQYIKPNQDAYNAGQQQFGTGLTDAELRNQNIAYERTGKTAIAVTVCLVSGGTACKAAASGLATTLGLSFLSGKPLTTAETIGGFYGGALGGVYGQALSTWAGGTNSLMQSAVLFVTKTGTIAAGKQIGVPLGNATGLAQPVDPFFDPSTNPWWGIRNTWDQLKGSKK